MADDQTFRFYLRDLGDFIGRMARQAKVDRDGAGPDDGYAVGRLMAFHEVVSLMQQQAVAFGLAAQDVGLGDLEPERDLL